MTNNVVNAALVARAKAILTDPKQEWPRIAVEPKTTGEIFTSYSLPLLLIAPIANFLGGQIFGYGAFGFSFRPSLIGALSTAITSFILSIVSLFVLMAIVEWLAPKFGGTPTRTNAFKLVAYSLTASALAGIFGLVPMLAWLGIVGLYSFYLFYTGVAPMLGVPADKALGFTVVTVICGIVLSLLVGVVAGSVAGLVGGMPSLPGSGGQISGNVNVPGVGSVDMGKLQAAADRAERAAQSPKPAVPGATLQALLPASIGGFTRTSIESTNLGTAGSNAEGRYEKDGQSFRLSVTDMSAMGALASMGAAMGVSQNREDANGYEKTETVDGRLVTERWDRSQKSGEYGTTIADRFMVRAQGDADDIAVLKAAVASVNEGQLAALAR